MLIVARAAGSRTMSFRTALLRISESTLQRTRHLAAVCEDTAAVYRQMAGRGGRNAVRQQRRAAALEQAASSARCAAALEQGRINKWCGDGAQETTRRLIPVPDATSPRAEG